MTPPTPCPSCGAEIEAGANFCEACGAQLGEVDATAAAAIPHSGADDRLPISRPTSRPQATAPVPPPAPRPCRECGGEVADDGYCGTCGAKAPTEREHFSEQPVAHVAGVCDRGRLHDRNEDAMALGLTDDGVVLVVCDGVSSSQDSDVASLAGARAAREVLTAPLPTGMGTDAAKMAAVTKVLNEAVAAANEAVIANTAADSANPASSTCTIVVVEPTSSGATLWHANVGDSRSYWLPDAGDPVQLTVDDSGAQQQIAAGVSREVAESSPVAHGITKWLGRDSHDPTPTIGRESVTQPGWTLICSDGLWNYASAAAALRTQADAAGLSPTADPLVVADALVAWANGQGGHDNITVALARVGNNEPESESTSTTPTSEEVPTDG